MSSIYYIMLREGNNREREINRKCGQNDRINMIVRTLYIVQGLDKGKNTPSEVSKEVIECL